LILLNLCLFTPERKIYEYKTREILGFHGDEYEDDSRPRYNAVSYRRIIPTFQRCILPPLSSP